MISMENGKFWMFKAEGNRIGAWKKANCAKPQQWYDEILGLLKIRELETSLHVNPQIRFQARKIQGKEETFREIVT